MGRYELRNRKRQTNDDSNSDQAPDKKSKLGTPVELLNLNDDCIDKVFSYLSYDEILTASEVCQRFVDRAQYALKRLKDDQKLFTVKADESKQLLRRVGPALLRLEIFFGRNVFRNQQTMAAITKYCRGSLKEITLHCLTKRNKLCKPFDGVEKLTLSFCDLIGPMKLSKWFPNLTTLTFHHTGNLNKFIKQSIPTMHTLNIGCATTQTEMITMLRSNPQIKNLSLNFLSRGSSRLLINHDLLTAVDNALPELQKLNLLIQNGVNFRHAHDDLHFKHLKMLKIEVDCDDCDNNVLVNNLSISPENLEHLQLRFSVFNASSSYSCITRFNKLRALQLSPVSKSLEFHTVLMLLNQLPLLEKIVQVVDFTRILPWTEVEVANFMGSSNRLSELSFVFELASEIKFDQTLSLLQSQFSRGGWMVKEEKRLAARIFDNFNVNFKKQDQYVIKVIKKC